MTREQDADDEPQGLSPMKSGRSDADWLDLARDLAPEYDATEIIGRGGAGRVFAAKRRSTGQPVALKLVHHRPRRNVLVRFRREARILQRLDHPHIITLYDWDIDDGCGWIAMERADTTVMQVLKRHGPLPREQAVEWAIQAGKALLAAHREGVVHRDVKPSNLLLRLGRVRVADFGIARTEDSVLTAAGSHLGSRSFMPPEQAYAPQLANDRSDVFGLSSTLYAMLTRLTPRGLYRLPTDHARWSRAGCGPMRELLQSCQSPFADDRPSMAELVGRLIQLS